MVFDIYDYSIGGGPSVQLLVTRDYTYIYIYITVNKVYIHKAVH